MVESNKQLKLWEVGKILVRKLNDGEFNDANLKLIIETVSQKHIFFNTIEVVTKFCFFEEEERA